MSHWFYITPEEYVEAEKIGIKPAMLDRRIRAQGWTKERAMTTPLRGFTNRRKWLQIALENGINKNTFYNRIRLGWKMEQAAMKLLQTSEEIREQALKHQNVYVCFPKNTSSLLSRMGFLMPLSITVLQTAVGIGTGCYRTVVECTAIRETWVTTFT